MNKAPKLGKASKIPIYNVMFGIKSAEATLNVAGDFHYGIRGIEEDEIVRQLTVPKKKDMFRIYTGDLVENSLKTSVGHNYDIAVPDPSDQVATMKKILTKVTKAQVGPKNWKNYEAPTKEHHECTLAAGVGGNHEYRTRKLSGQWIADEIYKEAKVLPMGQEGIIQLTLFNKKLNIDRTYMIYVAHAPGKTNATSIESIMRSFRKKQSTLPGIDIIVFGHYHRRFIQSSGYFDAKNDVFKKVLYVINPSPLTSVEYAIEAGYPPNEAGYSIDIYLPIEQTKQPYGVI